MIVSGGENVFPIEVENLVEAMPGVAEVASIGVAGRGIRPAAAAVRRTGRPAPRSTAKRSAHHVRENLARFKVPREVVFLDELPRTATGKVARRELPA